ncbi:hypothetical protein O0L34_g10248 [Tuta absoluta]|nr:hypothetical protein O0L34_g10248 [Tuta absoluta]
MASKCALNVLNSIYLILSVGMAIASIWFFVEVQMITTLRNSNHYMLDYNVYWPQAVPWMFFVVAVLAIIVASIGIAGVKQRSSGKIKVFLVFGGMVTILLIAAGIIGLVFANNETTTDKFIKDSIWDAFFRAKQDNEVENAFGTMEKRYHCCGAESPRDYKNWKDAFPTSCCDTYYHGWIGSYSIDCDFTNKLANERHGCSTVAAQYAKIAIMVLSAISILIALLGSFGFCTATALHKSMNKKPRVPPSEADSKKVLL